MVLYWREQIDNKLLRKIILVACTKKEATGYSMNDEEKLLRLFENI